MKVEVLKVKIMPHPNADKLEIAEVKDYKSIVGKGQYKTGDLVAYIPEASIVPDHILEELNLVGKLAGKDCNRVKAIKLRGVLSQGICYPAKSNWIEGDDVTSELGIVKYIPPVPPALQGDVIPVGKEYLISYDIENIKNYPNVLIEGEDIVITEKIHGTFCLWGYHPKTGILVSSKGLSSKGLAFDLFKLNTYTHIRTMYDDSGLCYVSSKYYNNSPVYVLGEIYGKGIQDLDYSADKKFRIFDIYVGEPTLGKYLNYDEFCSISKELDIPTAPLLFKGKYSKEIVLELTKGKETVSGQSSHIREGVVIKPIKERRDNSLGRVILKSISEDYLLRKNGTEYN